MPRLAPVDLAYRLAALPPIVGSVRRARGRQLLVVCYHGLAEDDAPLAHWLLVRRSAFAAQVAFLARHYDCLPVDEALDRLWSGRLTRPTAAVTFDDGYESNATIGQPILARHGVPATIYLATGLIGTDARLWTTSIELAVWRTPVRTVDLSWLDLGPLALDDDRSGGSPVRRAAARRIVARLKTLPSADRHVAQARVLAALDADGAGGAADDGGAFRLMDWDRVRRVAASGIVSFGGHTVNHEIVGRLDDDALAREIGESVATVAREVPDAVSRTFAYPNGQPADFDARAEAALARAGCVAAMTTVSGLNPPDTPRMRLRRVNVGDRTTLDRFAVQTTGLVAT